MMIRIATRDDLVSVVEMLADDPLGRLREDFQQPLPDCYRNAFEKIQLDSNQELVVAVDESGNVIGTLQLSLIQYLTYQGGIRAQIEAVRVHKGHRSQNVGRSMLQWAIQRAKENGAHVIQLTTDKKREGSVEFYEKLGFRASHEGMKLHL